MVAVAQEPVASSALFSDVFIETLRAEEFWLQETGTINNALLRT